MAEERDNRPAGKYSKADKKPFYRKPWGIAAIAVSCLVVLLVGAACGVAFGYQGVYPGVSVEGTDLGKMSKTQVHTILEQNYTGQSSELGQVVISVNGEEHDLDISQLGAAYDLEQTAENAYNYGRTGNIFQRLGQIATAAFQGKDLSLAISADENQVKASMGGVIEQIGQKVVEPSYQLGEDKLVIDRGEAGY